MIKKTAVSVIIPVYNTEQYLKQCFDSVCNQTLKDIEIICINDGSTDNSLQIIKEYANKYNNIKIINIENAGCYKARNTGLETAVGEYIGFVDSDDYIELDMFEKMYLKAKKENADIVLCNFYTLFDKTKEIKETTFKKTIRLLEKTSNRLIGAEKVIFDYSAIWNKIYKREFLIQNNIKFHPQLHMADDNFFHIVSLLKAKTIAHLQDALYYYRKQRKDSITKSGNENNFNCIEVAKEIMNYIKKENLNNFNLYINKFVLDLLFLGYIRINSDNKNKYFNKLNEFRKTILIKPAKAIWYCLHSGINLFAFKITLLYTLKYILSNSKSSLDFFIRKR